MSNLKELTDLEHRIQRITRSEVYYHINLQRVQSVSYLGDAADDKIKDRITNIVTYVKVFCPHGLSPYSHTALEPELVSIKTLINKPRNQSMTTDEILDEIKYIMCLKFIKQLLQF